MAILNFSDALTEARRRSQLQGRPLSQAESAGIAQGYTATAAERAAEQKRLALAEKSQAEQQELAERSQAAQERQFSESLLQQREQFGRNMELQMENMGMQNEQFSKNLELAYASSARSAGEFEKTYQMTLENNRAQREAAEKAFAQQQTNTYISAGIGILTIFALVAGAAYSDKRLKKNIRPITEGLNPMSLLENDEIRGVFYEWKDEKLGTETEIGFVAQMFEKVPGLTKEIEGILCLRYDRITALLWEQNRALLKRIKKLEEKAHV